MRTKIIAALGVVAVLGGAGWWLAATRPAAPAAGAAGGRVVTTAVTRGPIRATISGTGPVRAVNGTDVRAYQSGTVTDVRAQDGDAVAAGQTVVALENPQLQSSLRQAELDLQHQRTALTNLLSPAETAVEAQRLRVENARLTLDERREQATALTVTAPGDGVITAIGPTEGSDVTPGALLVTLYDDRAPTLTVPVPQEAATRIQPGQPAAVTIPGFGAVTGTVAPSAGGATPRSGGRDADVPITIALPPTPGLLPGMVGEVAMEVPGLTYLVRGSGTVDSEVVEVRAEVTGTVVDVAVHEGQRVAEGERLLTLENETLLIQLRQAENDLKAAEEELRYLLDPAADPDRTLEASQLRVRQAELTLEDRQRAVADLNVTAPVAGLISGLDLAPGDRVSAGQTLFHVADYGAMEVTIEVDELDIAQVRVGQRAEVLLDALPGRRFEGVVSYINPEGIRKNDIASFEVTVRLEQSDGILAGMTATVNILVAEKESALLLPAQAVQVQEGRAFVRVMEGGRPTLKEIRIGLRTLQDVEVTGGLSEGDEVILTIIQGEGDSLRGPGGFVPPGAPEGFRPSGGAGGGMRGGRPGR